MNNILIIDDEEILLKTFQKILAKAGFKSGAAQNGQEAIEMAKIIPFQLILCDIKIPGMNGFEIVRAIRRQSLLRQESFAPIIFMTGDILQSYETQIRECLYASCLLKPFNIWELVTRIHEQIFRYPQTSFSSSRAAC